MKRGVNMNTRHVYTGDTKIEDCIIGKKCGTITVSIYEETNSGSPIFHIQSDNEDVLPVSYVIEDILTLY